MTGDPPETQRFDILGARDPDGTATAIGVAEGRQTTPGASATLDATGLTVAPGFLDLQINGAFGIDFTSDPEGIWEAGRRLVRHGVTAFCPTIITAPRGSIEAAQRAIAQRPEQYVGAEPIGLHIEGPHLSHDARGTHQIDLLRPAHDASSTTDGVAITTIAPEIAGALELIEAMVAQGVVVSLGHSAATAGHARAALDAGATMGTHLFNAMPAMAAREPGLAGTLLTDERAWVGLIVDGHHLAREMIRLAWSAARERLVLVSDGIAALGERPGDYRIGPVDVVVSGGAARNATGDLAGAIVPLDRSVELLAGIVGGALPELVATVTSHPAAAVRDQDRGRLRAGRADLVLLDGFRVVATIVGGRIAHLDEPDRWSR